MKKIVQNRSCFVWLLIFSLVVLWKGYFTVSVSAAERAVPDLSRKGSIAFVIQDSTSKAAISGSEISVYKVADAKYQDGDYVLEYAEEFPLSVSEYPLQTENDLESEALLGKTEEAARNVSPWEKGVSDTNGSITFQDLDLGLYLIVNTRAADGYGAFQSFLMTVPYLEGDTYIYDVTAYPKAGTTIEKTRTPVPEKTKTIIPSKIPQTGQLWWPVEVLSALGILLLILGISCKRRKA